MNYKAKFGGSVLVLVGAILLTTAPARASLIISSQSVSAGRGSTGNPLEITLTNTGPSAVTVGGFTFEITTTDANITFTVIDFSTTPSPYIFAGQSLFGPALSTLPQGQTMDAQDVFAIFNSGATLASGATVGLGRALFNVASNAVLGPFAVTFVSGATSLADAAGSNLPISTPTAWQITVTTGTTATPEPSSVLMLGSVLLFLGWKRRSPSEPR
jgi:hypothetical protein